MNPYHRTPGSIYIIGQTRISSIIMASSEKENNKNKTGIYNEAPEVYYLHRRMALGTEANTIPDTRRRHS